MRALAIGLATAPLAFGAAAAQNVDVLVEDRIALEDWSYADLYAGKSWRAQQLLGAPVTGRDDTDEAIGEVANILVDGNGYVEAVLADVGGIVDVGETRLRVPWDALTVDFGGERPSVAIPVVEDSIERFNLFAGTDGELQLVEPDAPELQRTWRVTELIDDYVVLADGGRYGWVDDVVVGGDGLVQAVIVPAVGGPGPAHPYAYPFYGYEQGYRPGRNYYAVPYDADEVTRLEPVELDKIVPSDAAG